jgi:hypothetical protein
MEVDGVKSSQDGICEDAKILIGVNGTPRYYMHRKWITDFI